MVVFINSFVTASSIDGRLIKIDGFDNLDGGPRSPVDSRVLFGTPYQLQLRTVNNTHSLAKFLRYNSVLLLDVQSESCLHTAAHAKSKDLVAGEYQVAQCLRSGFHLG